MELRAAGGPAEGERLRRRGEPLNGKTCVFVQQALDLLARDPDKIKTVICLMDGEKALRAEQHEWLPRAIGVLDIWHVMERLWAVAYCFHAEQRLRRPMLCHFYTTF